MWGWGGGGSGGEEGGKRVKARPRVLTRKTEEAVDRRQNNRSVKAVSPRHCVTTSVLCNCYFNCCAEQLVTKTMSVTLLMSNNSSERSPAFRAQIHLLVHETHTACKMVPPLVIPSLSTLRNELLLLLLFVIKSHQTVKIFTVQTSNSMESFR